MPAILLLSFIYKTSREISQLACKTWLQLSTWKLFASLLLNVISYADSISLNPCCKNTCQNMTHITVKISTSYTSRIVAKFNGLAAHATPPNGDEEVGPIRLSRQVVWRSVARFRVVLSSLSYALYVAVPTVSLHCTCVNSRRKLC